jgi:hypothetical protein
MAHQLCPICDQAGRLVVDLGKGFYVQYYRCDPCDHVWSQSNLISDVPPVSIPSLPVIPRKKQQVERGITTPRARRRRVHLPE